MKKLVTLVLFVLTTGAYAQSQYFNNNGIAINGYDPVAFFTENAAMEGSKQYSYEWNGTTWQFKNAANRDSFKSNPEKYAPQFGGYCAYGMSENHKAPTEPQAFTIVDNKLYLNYNMEVLKMWRKDTKGRITKAEMNWKSLKDKKD
jgi:YHS domain-containing protein